MPYGHTERKRQSGFRDSSLSIFAAGRTPCEPRLKRNGHLLAGEYETDDLLKPIRCPGGPSCTAQNPNLQRGHA